MPPRKPIHVACPSRTKINVVQRDRRNVEVTCASDRSHGLSKHGYTDVGKKTAAQRRPALVAAVREYGAPLVAEWLRKLENFNKNAHPQLARRFRLDRGYVERM